MNKKKKKKEKKEALSCQYLRCPLFYRIRLVLPRDDSLQILAVVPKICLKPCSLFCSSNDNIVILTTCISFLEGL